MQELNNDNQNNDDSSKNDFENNNENNENPRSSLAKILIGVSIAALIAAFVLTSLASARNGSEITYAQFISLLNDGKVKSVEIGKESAVIVEKSDDQKDDLKVVYTVISEDDTALTERLSAAGVEFKKDDMTANETLTAVIGSVVQIVLMMLLFLFVMRRLSGGGGGAMGMNKSRAKVYIQKNTGITFSDVAGEDEAKESLQEVVDFLHNPRKYTSVGAKLPK